MDPVSIHSLPDEVLLFIFRYLPANEFIAVVSQVCKRWSKIVMSDAHTLKQIGMSHNNLCKEVNFFYLKNLNEDQIFYNAQNFGQSLFDLICTCSRNTHYYRNKSTITYETAFYLCTQYSEIFKHVKTLLISISMEIYQTKGFTYTNNLTTLVFNNAMFLNSDQSTFMELGKAYPNIQNVLYLFVNYPPKFNTEILYIGFEKLKRFRLDHYSINYRFLEDLLKAHPSLELIIFNEFTGLNDVWIDVLMEQLKGRTIKSLTMHSPYFTDKRVNEFLMSDLVLDKSKIDISKANDRTTFSISII